MSSTIKFFDENSFFAILAKGGWVMIPITVLSIISVYFVIERFLALRSSEVYMSPEKLEAINKKLIEGDYDMVYDLCSTRDLPMANIIKAGIDRFASANTNFESAIEIAARVEVQKLEKNTTIIANIASMATLLGFFGTVTGMISAFMTIAAANGPVAPNLIAAGIYEALITTAAGLFVGIIALAGYNFVSGKVNKITAALEKSSNELIDLLKNLKRINNAKKH